MLSSELCPAVSLSFTGIPRSFTFIIYTYLDSLSLKPDCGGNTTFMGLSCIIGWFVDDFGYQVSRAASILGGMATS